MPIELNKKYSKLDLNGLLLTIAPAEPSLLSWDVADLLLTNNLEHCPGLGRRERGSLWVIWYLKSSQVYRPPQLKYQESHNSTFKSDQDNVSFDVRTDVTYIHLNKGRIEEYILCDTSDPK